MTIDETGGIANSSVQVDLMTANGTYSSSELAITFDNTTNRYLELRGHQGGTGVNGGVIDFRLDGISIDIVPESSSALFGALSCLCLLRRRR